MSNITDGGANPVTATADIEMDDDTTMNDVTENEIVIDLDPMYAKMLASLREEHGRTIDDNLETYVHNLISETYLDER